MIDRDKIPELTDVINVKEFIDSITEEDDELFHRIHKDGRQFTITYKRYTQELLEGKTEIMFRELVDMYHDGDKIEDIAKRHVYPLREID
jgi:hypothetical protein